MSNGSDEMTSVKAPTGKWDWNLNTLVILLGFGGGLIAWGGDMGDRLDKRVTAVEATIRQIDTHELRISSVEKRAAEAATSMRAVESTLNALAPTCGLRARCCSGSRPASATARSCGADRLAGALK